MFIETSSEIAKTYIQKFVIDEVFILGKYHLLPLYLMLFMLAFIINSALMTMAPYKYVHNEYRMDDILLLKMLRRFFRIPMSRIQNERTARYVQYVTADLYTGGTMIGYHSPIGVQNVLHVVALMIIVGLHSWQILLSVTILSTAYIAGGYYFSKHMKAVSREVKDNMTKVSVHLEESISATREIIAYHRTEWEAKIYNALYKDYFQSVVNEAKMQNKQMMFSEPIRLALTLSVLGFGGYQLFENNMSLGAFVIVFQFANQLMDSYQRLFWYAMDFSGMLASIDRMDELLNEEQIEVGNLPIENPITSVCFKQVSFAYKEGERNVLQDLTFELPTGQKIAFVGASGGGKSTIAQLLMRFYEPISGAIIVNGISLSKIRREDWTKRVKIVFQDPYMMADTLRTNLCFGREYFSREEIDEAFRSAQLYDDISILPNQYEEEIGERGVQLSGGQKQRLALARAILDDPEILILDEATSSLDLETERRLQARLDDIRKGKTTIIIAHRLSTVQNADIIFVMEGGCIVEKGTHDDLMRYGKLYPSIVAAQDEVTANR